MMQSLVDKLYGLTDKGLLRALSLLLALVMAGAIFWDPSKFAACHCRGSPLRQGGLSLNMAASLGLLVRCYRRRWRIHH